MVDTSITEDTNLISVVIPTFNHAAFLSNAIDSVLSQTYRRFEIVVIDDGSIDNTQYLLRERYRDLIRYIAQPNKGLAAARNLGLRECRGQYEKLAGHP